MTLSMRSTTVAAAVAGVGVAAALALRPSPLPLPDRKRAKTVLITGGTTGLGRATVQLLAASGDIVFTCGRTSSLVAELAHMPNVHAWCCDVTDEASVVAFVARVADALGDQPLDVLVNNAGVLRIGEPLLAMDTASFDQTWGVNVRGVFLMTRCVWPLLARGREPLVVNVGSSTEHFNLAQAFHSTYAMSKCALKAFSQGLRQEASVIHPGARVVHLKVGAHQSDLDHDADKAARRLASFGPPFAEYAEAHGKHIREAFEMVTFAPASSLSGAIRAIVHASGGPSSLVREYHVNVSFLERLVEWLPGRIMDITIGKAYAKL